MKFRFADRVFVKAGFHKGRHGVVFDRRLFRYGVTLFPDWNYWFWPWQIGKTFTVRPADNAETMENVRRAQEIIESLEAAK